ncbi:DUF155-domain-containing protein [Thozetella sp. PMI_491]|nr:DUF155-domain-containing protein [Thozetella sp. PMI_491]
MNSVVMASDETEISPLLPSAIASSSEPPRPRPARTVTFNVNPVSKTIEPEGNYESSRSAPAPYGTSTTSNSLAVSSASGAPVLSALNSKLRRRNSQGAVSTAGLPMAALQGSLPKIGPQRSTKNAQKLKLLPNPEVDEDGLDEESGRDVYSQYTRIKDPTARRDAARLGKADRDRLPRVTAYCTANKYQMDGLLRYLKGRAKARGANPKLIDECIYTPYSYSSKQVGSAAEVRSSLASNFECENVASQDRGHPQDGLAGAFPRDIHGDLLSQGVREEGAILDEIADFDIQVHTPEVFLFDYGVVVVWGMSVAQEQRFLREIAKFETEKLAPDDVETEFFNFYYTREYQPRIYNDFITLRDKSNYMTKLAISHALAQSVKTSLFEELIASTIDTCKDIPTQIAMTGKINLGRTQINMQIGELFILRINIHLNGSVLDTPELFWVEPQLEPVYQAVRSYLEMDQRVGLLTERLDVIADLLAVLKDQLSHGHGEKLEWIVVVLIAAEILVAAVNIFVDLYAGVD